MGKQAKKNGIPDPKILAEASNGCASFLLRKTSRLVSRKYDEAFRPEGIKNTQFTLLAVIHQLGPLLPKDLAEKIDLDRSTLSRNLGNLENEGFIAFGLSGDARQRPVTLTSKGQRKLAAALPLWKSAQKQLKKELGPDADRLFQVLESSLKAMSFR